MKQTTVDYLIKNEFDGQHLNDFNQEDYEKLGLGKAVAIQICKIKEKFLMQNKVKEEKRKCVQQVVRPFGKPCTPNMFYQKGNYIKQEIGAASLFEPSREFKSIIDSQDKFVKWVKQFVIGCLNRRCNGTIYFGVQDKDHGMVTGIKIPKSDFHKIQDLVDKNFVNPDALQFKGTKDKRMKTAVGMCLKPIQCVPVVGGEEGDEIHVIEIDVEPSWKNCESFVFYAKKEKNDPREIYIRKGAAIEKKFITKTQKKETQKKEMNEISKEIEKYTNDRYDEERKLAVASEDLDEKLRRLICLGKPKVEDKEHRYFLMFNPIEFDDNFHEDFKWLTQIKWTLVVDVDETKSILKYVSESSDLVRKPKVFGTKEMEEELKGSDCLEKNISFGEYTAWLMCSCDSKPLKNWHNSDKGTINKMFSALTNVNAIVDQKKIIVIVLLGSQENIEKLSYLLKDLHTLGLAQNQFVCLYKDTSNMETLDNKIGDIFNGDEWRNQKVQISQWNHLNSFFKQRKSGFNFQGLKLPCSSRGLYIDMPKGTVDYFLDIGIDILGTNSCEDLVNQMDADAITKLANDTILNFFKGAQPTWELFYFSEPCNLSTTGKIYPGVIKRDYVEDLKKDILRLNQLDSNVVEVKQIVHEPGAGASTIAKHVLWLLKNEIRCIAINGRRFTNGDAIDIKEVDKCAEAIFAIRGLGEDPQTSKGRNLSHKKQCVSVLILLDNGNEDLAAVLSAKLEEEVRKRQIVYDSTMFIILNISSSTGGLDSTQDQDCQIEQKLFDSETEMFANRLRLLEKTCKVEDMLSFVIMAENFNEESEYVKTTVESALKGIKRHPKERQLLLYLALLKWYGNSGLPVKHCEAFVFPPLATLSAQTSFLDRLCRQVKLFVNEYQNEHIRGTCPFRTVEVTHSPVAFQVIRHLITPFTELPNVVSEMIQEHVFASEDFMSKEISIIFRKLLLFRQIIEIIGNSRVFKRKSRYSDLILEISKQSFGNEKATALLEVGFNHLTRQEDKAYVAQGLARLHIYKGTLDIAEFWSQKAIALLPFNFAMFDTLGQVYKKKLG